MNTPKNSLTALLSSSSLGTVFEWYDFILYIFLAGTLSPLFFPHESKYISLLLMFAIFSLSYLVRPIGGLFFGYLGDKIGRKKIFTATIFLMSVPTFLIALLPTYSAIGIAAPLLLLTFRLLQGISAGGEFVGSSTFALESVEKNKQCFTTATIWSSAGIGVIIGSLLVSLLTSLLSPAAFANWGWRVLFLIGATVGIVAYWIRANIQESHEFLHIKQTRTIEKNPLKTVLKNYKFPSLVIMGGIVLANVYLYLVFLFMPTFAGKILNFPLSITFYSNTLNMLALLLFTVIAGYIADRYPRVPLMLIGSGALAVLTVPLYSLIISKTIPGLFLAQFIFACLLSLYQGPMVAKLITLVPPNVRYTATGLSYNLATSLFGGTSPLLVVYWIHKTHNFYVLSIYLTIIASIVFAGILFTRYLKLPLIHYPTEA